MQTVRTLILALALLGAGAAPALAADPADLKGANSPKLESGTPFTPAYMVEHWRQNPNSGPLETTPSAQARGYISEKTPVGAAAGVLKQPGVSDMVKKLERLIGEVKANPALKEPRGVSLSSGIAIGNLKGGPMDAGVAGKAYVMAFPIFLEDKDTRRHPDGTYSTPGEGDSLTIVVNDTSILDAAPKPLGTYNGLTVVRVGSGLGVVVVNSEQPLTVTIEGSSGPREVLNPKLLDASRPRSDIQLLVAYLGAGSPTFSSINRGKSSPTSGPGRLLGALFTTDWPGLVKKLK